MMRCLTMLYRSWGEGPRPQELCCRRLTLSFVNASSNLLIGLQNNHPRASYHELFPKAGHERGYLGHTLLIYITDKLGGVIATDWRIPLCSALQMLQQSLLTLELPQRGYSSPKQCLTDNLRWKLRILSQLRPRNSRLWACLFWLLLV